MNVLIAGIAGASLGTEIAKCLHKAGDYNVFGCDISHVAYGHFDQSFKQTECIDIDNYIPELLAICKKYNIQFLIAGAEKTMLLISDHRDLFENAGINVCQNNSHVVRICNNKSLCFKVLSENQVKIPKTRQLHKPEDLVGFPSPCIIKPALDSGGSAYVFYCQTIAEAELYCSYLLRNGQIPIAQSYIDHSNGEYTVGVLSQPNGEIAGSIALRRSFENKLSISARGDNFLISSGISQGEIRKFSDIRKTAEKISLALGSTGPLNIQGRLNPEGDFVPFEINPRFSASTFLRTMAGFNEVDYYLKCIQSVEPKPELSINEGWYLRSLEQIYTKSGKI